MYQRFGKEIEHNYTRNNEGDADECGSVERLVIEHPPNQRNQGHPDTRPDSVGNAEWNRAQREREKVERPCIPDDDKHRGHQTGEALCGFE